MHEAAYRRIYFAKNRELGLLLMHLVCVLFLLTLSSPTLNRFGVIAGSISLAAILFYGAYAQVRRSVLMVWSPLVWFRVATAVFFGLGNLVPYFANAETEGFIRSLYNFSDATALEVVVVVSLSVLVVLAVARFFFIRVQVNTPQVFGPRSSGGHLSTALFFLVLGGFFRYGVILPNMYGWEEALIPGWMKALSGAYSAGIFLALLWTLRHRRSLIVFPLMLVVVDVFVGALAFDKSEMVFTLLFAFLAFLYHKFNLSRIMIGLGIVFGIIYFAQSPAHYGRYFVENSRGGAVSVAERIGIISRYMTEGDTVTRYVDGGLNPFLRLSYIAPASYVVDEFNQGRPGHAHRHAFAALVPRVLWPGKPSIGSAGAQLYYMIRGQTGASIGVGHFAESYWSFGWVGPFIVFIPGGLMLSLVALISLQVVRSERWLMFPVVLYGINIGYKVSGTWVSGVVGSFATFLVLTAIFWFLSALVADLARSRGHRVRYAAPAQYRRGR